MSICNTPVTLDSIIKGKDVSRACGSRPQTADHRSSLSAPLTPGQVQEKARRTEHWDALHSCPGIAQLVRLRLMWSEWKRARRNAIEEAPHALACEKTRGKGAAWDAGYAVGIPPSPTAAACIKKVSAAVAAGLPRDLESLCAAWLGQQEN